MNPFEMVVLIVGIGAIVSMYRAKHGIVRNRRASGAIEEFINKPSADTERMRGEITMLKERIAVLERLATDTNSAALLDREIEKLR